MDKVREIALKTLYQIDQEGAYSNIVLNEMLQKNQKILQEKDVGLISEIVYGVTTWKLTLDEIIKKYSKIRLKKISPWILNILRMSIYQIVFLNKIPKSAAVNEGVNLAKRYGHRSSTGFTNAVLRKVTKQDYQDFFQIEDQVERISKTTSMPEWIIEELKKEGKTFQEIEEICIASNQKPELSIRINSLKTNREELIKQLQKRKIIIEEGILKDFLRIKKARSIENWEEFQNGEFTIQDEAAGLIAVVLDPKPKEKVLDACSSPGGKTTYLAQMMKNQGEIEAWDIHNHRVKLVEQTAKRLGITIIKTKVQDATKYQEEKNNYFDKILLDVPCLGIGVLKRKPDIKWQKKKEDMKEIIKVQEEILKQCAKYLKPRGELVYSTCSILKEENENIIEKFVKENPNFEIIKIENNFAEKENFWKKFIVNQKYLQVYPNGKTDGFFICKLHKKA